MLPENDPRKSPGRIDLFADVLRCFVDWQASRTRWVLNEFIRAYVLTQSPRVEVQATREQIEDDALAEPFYDPRPRATPLLDASVLLHYATGERPIPDTGVEFDPDVAHFEPTALAPRNGALVFPSPDADATLRPATMIYASYDDTRQALGFLARVLQKCDQAILLRFPALAPFREIAFDVWARNIVAQARLGQPIPDGLWITDDLIRLLNLADGISLGKQPGIIYLPWFHPFEMSNDLSGWNLVEGVDPIRDRRLWLKPTLAMPPVGEPAYDALNAAWRLSQTVHLYPGQALVSDADSHTGTRDPHADVTDVREEKRLCLGLVSMTPLPPNEVPRRTPTNPVGPLPFMIGLAPASPTQSASVPGVRISGVEFFVDHAIDADPVDPRRTVARLAGVLDLDGGIGTVVERVSIIAGQRKVPRLGPQENRVSFCDGHLVQLGVGRASLGAVFDQCYFQGSARGILRFGPMASGCLVLGGEFNGWLYAERSGMIQWDAGSSGNSVIDISIELGADDVLATLLMNGRAGAFDIHRPEPPKTTCDLSQGGEGLQFRARHFVLVGPTGVDNVVVSSSPMGTTIRDLGLGTWVRDFKDTNGARIGTLLTNQSWDNLLTDPNFASMAAPNGQPLNPRWRPSDTALISVDPPGVSTRELKIARRAMGARNEGGKAMVSQELVVWSDASPPARLLPEQDRADIQECVIAAQRGTAESPRFEGMRSFVFVCRVLAPPGETAAIALAAKGVNRSLAIAHAHFTQPADGSAGWQELTTRLVLPPTAVRLEVQLIGPGRFASPALVEGVRVPTEPLSAVSTGPAAMNARLVVPDATAMLAISPATPAVISEPAVVRRAAVASATPWRGGDAEIVVERFTSAMPDEAVPLATGIIRHGDTHVSLNTDSDAPLQAGDLLMARTANRRVRGGLAAEQWRQLHICIAINQPI